MMPEIIKDTFHLEGSRLNSSNIKSAKTSNKITYGKLFQKIDNGFGKEILKPIASNTVVFGGAVLALEKLCGTNAKFKPASLNDIYDVPVSGTTGPSKETIALFGCGTGGSGMDFTSVISPDIKQRDVIDLIPMRYGTAITDEDSSKYFLKKANTADPGTYSWYLKEFDTTPIVTSYWKNAVDTKSDGTEITSEIYNSDSTEGIETLAEFEFSINSSDISEYFDAIGESTYARYNTFGFYTGEYVESAREYGNVRLFSVVTFKNRDVTVETSSRYVYRVYALI